MALAGKHGVSTMAFPGISTGVFGYPAEKTARVAVDTTRTVLDAVESSLTEVIFCCFSRVHLDIYEEHAADDE